MQNLAQAFRDDPAFRNRLLGFVVLMTLIVGAFGAGFELEVRVGRQDRGEVPLAADGDFGTADGRAGDGLVVGPGGTVAPRAGTGGASAPGVGRSAGVGRSSGASGGGTGGATTAGGSDGGGSSGGTGSTGGGGCDGATLRATDQGVGEDTIKIGILKAELGNLSELGFEAGIAVNQERIMDAWVNELNANGGVACREVTYVAEYFDVLSVDDMLAKCRSMTKDHKVFAVLTAGGYDSVAQLCIARDNATPFVNTEPEPSHWYEESAPYLWTTLMTKDRIHRNHVRWLVEAGEITRESRIGVVYHGIPNVGPSVERSLLPELDRHRIEPVRVTKLSSDNEQAIAQISQVVVDFQARGIDYVMMPMNLIFKSQFMQQAEKQNYYPTYTDSDHYYGCFDFVTGPYPADSWDRTKCVTAAQVAGMRPADLEAYADSDPYQQYADQVYLRTHPDGYDHGGEYDEDTADAQRAIHSVMGTLTLLWAEAADRVGPEITRAAWGREMGRTGSFDKHTSPEPLSFREDKWDGPDHISVVEWHAEGGDGWDPRMYRQIVTPFPAYY